MIAVTVRGPPQAGALPAHGIGAELSITKKLEELFEDCPTGIVPSVRGDGTVKNVSTGSVLLTASALSGTDGTLVICGLVIPSTAVRNPLGPVAGAKITCTEHDAPPAIVNDVKLAQLPLLTEKSAVSPVMVTLAAAAVVVGLESVTFLRLEVPFVPIATGPIATDPGETFSAFVPATVPLICIV